MLYVVECASYFTFMKRDLAVYYWTR